MDEQLRNGLLSLAIDIYNIGYLLINPDHIIVKGNKQIARWLDQPLDDYLGAEVSAAIPELVGSEELLRSLAVDGPAFRIETVFRPSVDNRGDYFDIHAVRLGGGSQEILVTTVDVTHKARQEQMLQQQRNEVQLLSAELALANERLSYMLNRLVPPAVAGNMMRSRNLPKPGGEIIRDATILFADMRDFTAFAEVYQPGDTLDFLNTYLAVVSEAVLRHDGSLVQLVGDMVMGVFNIPDVQNDHAVRGVRAAVDIQESLQKFNASSGMHLPQVSFGVGVSSGPVISGYLGVQQRFRYAVVGDATNVAFHLSSLAAAGRILISESTVNAVGDGFSFHEKGEIQLKRRRKLVRVYELYPPIPQP